MDLKAKKTLLEAYGFLRMAIGIGEIVGLCSAYFLFEFIINYPPQALLYVFDVETITVISLVVLTRGMFHIAAGIGIVRIGPWVRFLLFAGWPLLMIMTLGVIQSLYGYWHDEGFVASWADIISWPKVFVYSLWIAFDLFFVTAAIRALNDAAAHEAGILGRMEIKKVAGLFSAAVLFFTVLIFLGSPIKQGFHKGFYKSRGEKAQVQKGRGVYESQKYPVRPKPEDASEAALKADEAKLEGEIPEPDGVFRKVKESSVTKADESHPDAPLALSAKPGEVQSGLAYRMIIGLSGGGCLLIGLFFQLLAALRKSQDLSLSLSSGAFLAAGFFLWIVYGVSLKMMPIIFTSVAAFLLCAGTILLKCKDGE